MAVAAGAARPPVPSRAEVARARARAHESVVQRVGKLRQALEDTGITFDSTFRAFRHRGRVIRGLTPVLKRTMWPRYKYKVVNDAKTRKFRKTDSTLRRSSDGRRRGSRVHLQLEVLTNRGVEDMKRSGQQLHPYTLKLLLAFKRWGWRPVTSELPVVDTETGVATAADIVCSDARGGLILVETKTGYYGTWERASGPMEGPLSGILSDSPRSQALVQLLATKRMIERHGCHVDRAYVVRVDEDGVTPESIFPDLDRRANVVAAFIDQRLRAEAERKKRRHNARVSRG